MLGSSIQYREVESELSSWRLRGLASPEAAGLLRGGGMVLGKFMGMEGSGACEHAWLNPCRR